MSRSIAVLLFVTFAVVACYKPPPPPPPPPPPVLCDVWSTPDECECPPKAPFAPVLGVCAPPRVDRPIDWKIAGYGVTAFSLALRDTAYIKDFSYHVQRHGGVILRVGAQTSHDWCSARALTLANSLEYNELEYLANQDLLFHMASNSYLPCGPFHGTPEADANLARLLEVTARIHNMNVQLIPTFTYKSHDEGTQAKNIKYFNAMFDHVDDIVKAGDYKHVIYEEFNEVEHPLSQHIKDEDVREMLLHARSRTDLPIGTDFHGLGDGLEWRGRYPFQWRDVSDYIAFHTPRNPEPRYEIMREAQDKFNYSKPVWVDETVCWASQANVDKYNLRGKGTVAMNGHGTEQQRWDQVVKHLRDIAKVGPIGRKWRPFFHAIWLMECTELGRLPQLP